MSSAHVAEEAISHRILAVQALNEALSVPPKTRIERDARMAAALALAFQSSHLQDGLLEFLTMVRGCNLIAMEGARDIAESAFYVCDPFSVFAVSILFCKSNSPEFKLMVPGFWRGWTPRNHAKSPLFLTAECGEPN